ncbi:hypothetical protein [Streptomyces sp. JHA26]|uniref:hypothetical protein n=1 Tax=Streptomyces sp. JHA26 TaxID=1917143 RepID=UPI00098A5603|nr:hypothetical protein [Streptomyces sp. JHA26]
MPQDPQARLAELRQEYRAGEEQLGRLVRHEAELRETLLRISGAVQVLEELTGPDGEPQAEGGPGGAPRDAGAVRTDRGS